MPKVIKLHKSYPIEVEFNGKSIFISTKTVTKDFENFTFLNETFSLIDVGFDNAFVSKLWRYNFHYFDYINQHEKIYLSNFKIINLIDNWIVSNKFGNGTGWEPYPTSVRIVNWIKWHWKTKGLKHSAKVNLWNQVRWLSKNLEYHLLGNHLFVNVKALLFASAFFGLDANSQIFNKACKILNIELEEQFLSDGAHFELSPMYHSLAMEDLLDLINISNNLPPNFPLNKIKQKFQKGMQWLQTMIYDNEELSHFNDCANDIAPKFNKLVNYAYALGINLPKVVVPKFNYHKSSGFFVLKDNGFHLIADIGKIGPDYLPGHAHADTLSFELAIKGQRVIVNSGTSVYGSTNERLRQRGTSAHSTVQIDNQDSSEVWSGFRVANRAVPFDINVNYSKDNLISLSASHDGYKRILTSPIHKREFIYSNTSLEINDDITGSGNQVVSRYFIHPDIEISKVEEEFLFCKSGEVIVKLSLESAHDALIYDSTYHDKFGASILNKCIQITSKSPQTIKVKFHII